MAQTTPDESPNLAQLSSQQQQQPPLPPSNTGPVSYQFNYYRFRGYYEFISLQPPRIFHVQVRNFSFHRRPKVSLHDGPSASHPILGVSSFSSFSSKFQVGLGNYCHDRHRQQQRNSRSKKDEEGSNNMRWGTMTRTGHRSATYTWNLPADDAAERPRTGPFRWETDHEWTYCKYVLLDAAGRELARYARNPGLKSGGALVIHESLGQDFEAMAMLTLMAMYLKEKDEGEAGAWGGAAAACA